MGRPAFEVTEKVINKAEELAAQGLTLEQIARVLGICYKTLNEKKKEFSALSEAIKDGQAKGVGEITNALFLNAKDGNTTAQIFYLKNRAPDEWKDRQHVEQSGETITRHELDDETIKRVFSQIEAFSSGNS